MALDSSGLPTEMAVVLLWYLHSRTRSVSTKHTHTAKMHFTTTTYT
jgi:hypothetical protein